MRAIVEFYLFDFFFLFSLSFLWDWTAMTQIIKTIEHLRQMDRLLPFKIVKN